MGSLIKIFIVIILIISSYSSSNCKKESNAYYEYNYILGRNIITTDEWDEIDSNKFNPYSRSLRYYRPFKELYKYVKEFYWEDEFVLLFGEVNTMTFLFQDSSMIFKRLPGVTCDFCFFVKQPDNKTRLVYTKSVKPVIVISDIELSNDTLSFSNFDKLYDINDSCDNISYSAYYNILIYAFLNDGYKESFFRETWIYPFKEKGNRCHPEQSKELVKILQFLTKYDLFTYNPLKD